MYSTNYITEQIKQRISIVDIADEYGLKLKKAGRTFKAHCPSHIEKTPSFMVFPKTNTYKCFGCGIYGDQINLYALLNGVDNGQAYNELKKRIGIYGTPKLSEEQRLEVSKSFEDKVLERKFYIEIKRLYSSICTIRDLIISHARNHKDMEQLENDHLYIQFCQERHDFDNLIDTLLKCQFEEIDMEQQTNCYKKAKGVEDIWVRLLEVRKLTSFVIVE